ncbi:unnamed protein product [Bursaphelenchus xylophilus]|uniref:(pine wood nematode) hypothetical protein n=1 Tax=Bursaphelenchus xylophilus TaxID=6326 RepID=A0A811LPC1_BURXY|nr:unnamed protein product [Bursaphelenchus xylophilus]CAG9120728.1 unnamed protein product [Bursaphelenchus xylophilus]
MARCKIPLGALQCAHKDQRVPRRALRAIERHRISVLTEGWVISYSGWVTGNVNRCKVADLTLVMDKTNDTSFEPDTSENNENLNMSAMSGENLNMSAMSGSYPYPPNPYFLAPTFHPQSGLPTIPYPPHMLNGWYPHGLPYGDPNLTSSLQKPAPSPANTSSTNSNTSSPKEGKPGKIVVNRLTKEFYSEEDKLLYEERRAKNNAAARESRKRRAKRESEVMSENEQLKAQVANLKRELTETIAELKVMRMKVGEALCEDNRVLKNRTNF